MQSYTLHLCIKVMKRSYSQHRKKTHSCRLKEKYEEHPKRKAIYLKIMECIALDNQPFSIIQDAGFTKLVEFLEPRYAMPSPKYFSDVTFFKHFCAFLVFICTLLLIRKSRVD